MGPGGVRAHDHCITSGTTICGLAGRFLKDGSRGGLAVDGGGRRPEAMVLRRPTVRSFIPSEFVAAKQTHLDYSFVVNGSRACNAGEGQSWFADVCHLRLLVSHQKLSGRRKASETFGKD